MKKVNLFYAMQKIHPKVYYSSESMKRYWYFSAIEDIIYRCVMYCTAMDVGVEKVEVGYLDPNVFHIVFWTGREDGKEVTQRGLNQVLERWYELKSGMTMKDYSLDVLYCVSMQYTDALKKKVSGQQQQEKEEKPHDTSNR